MQLVDAVLTTIKEALSGLFNGPSEPPTHPLGLGDNFLPVGDGDHVASSPNEAGEPLTAA